MDSDEREEHNKARYERWVTPANALRMIPWDRTVAINWLSDKLEDDLVGSICQFLSTSTRQLNFAVLPQSFWKGWEYPSASDFWQTGTRSSGMRLSGTYTTVRAHQVRFCPTDIEKHLAGLGLGVLGDYYKSTVTEPKKVDPSVAISSLRAPPFKAGHPPSDAEIIAKADEMRARGMRSRDISKLMRHETGFENVATRDARALIDGRYPRTGRKGMQKE